MTANYEGDSIRGAVFRALRSAAQVADTLVRTVRQHLGRLMGDSDSTILLNRTVALGAAAVGSLLLCAPTPMRHDEVAGALLAWAVALWATGKEAGDGPLNYI